MQVTHLHYLDCAAALRDLQTGNWGASALYGNNAFVGGSTALWGRTAL